MSTSENSLDFVTLRLFLAVAKHGSFTRAAIQLGVTQSTISKRVQQLEQQLGNRLLYRHGRGVGLTDAGERLVKVARAVFAQLDEVRDELAEGAHDLRGWVTLGLPPSLGASISVPLARRFRSAFPNAGLRVIESFSGSLLELLEAGKMDIAVLYDARLSATLLVNPLFRENLYLVENGRSKAGDEAEIAELADGPFVLSHSSNGLRRILEDAATVAGIEIRVPLELDSLTALKQVAETGPERCVLPFGAVNREVRDGKLRARRFAGDGLSALLVSATPLHRPIRRLTLELQTLLIEQVRDSIAEGVLTGKLLR